MQQESTIRYLQEGAGRPHSLLGLPCLAAAILQHEQGGVHAPHGLAGVQQGSQAPAGHARRACNVCRTAASYLTCSQACGRALMCLQRGVTACLVPAGFAAVLMTTFQMCSRSTWSLQGVHAEFEHWCMTLLRCCNVCRALSSEWICKGLQSSSCLR